MTTSAAATRVVLSYDPPDEAVGEKLEQETYRSYLRRARSGPVDPGDTWAEFVNEGCGTTQAVELRVESVEGGGTVAPDTEFVFRPSTA